MNKNRAFVKNTIILFVGKFATQFMSLLLLPLYTHYLLTEDYGTVDLLQTYISLFIPVLTLRIDSAVFRFLIDKRKNNDGIKKVLSNIFLILGAGVLFTVLVAFVLSFFFRIAYFKSVIVNTVVMMISSIMLQILRGLGKNVEYSIASVITGAATLISNAILIIVLNFDANSILIGSSIANIICILYVVLNINILKYISFEEIDKSVLKDILNYSLPMIPNALSWWIVNVSDRTIISMFLGVAANGIYTVSCKFSNILNSIFSIVSMSWQESATLHINDEDRDEYFSNMINSIFMIFSTISLLIISVLPFVYDVIIGSNYMSSYNYVPILLYANSWNVLIGLIGSIYIAKKRTKEIASTTIVSALINIAINLVLIKFIGLLAACVSTLLSYMVMSLYRYYDCQKYVKLKLKFIQIILFSLIYVVSSIIYLNGNMILKIFNLIMVMIFSIIINKDMIYFLISIISTKINDFYKNK